MKWLREVAVSLYSHHLGKRAPRSMGVGWGRQPSAFARSVHSQVQSPLTSMSLVVPHHNSFRPAFCLLKTYYVPVSWLNILCPALVYKPHKDQPREELGKRRISRRVGRMERIFQTQEIACAKVLG